MSKLWIAFGTVLLGSFGVNPTGRAVAINAQVSVSSVIRHGDTTEVQYTVRNSSTSSARISTFTLPRDVPLVKLDKPGPGWLTLSHYGNAEVVQWGTLRAGLLEPGGEAAALSYTAIGTLEIVDAELAPYYPAPDANDPNAGGDTPPSAVVQVVAIAPLPTSESKPELLFRLQSTLRTSCSRGWIAPVGICQSLTQKLSNTKSSLDAGRTQTAKNQLSAFRAELAAQKGVHISLDGYWILEVQADDLSRRL